ncbi:MAG: protein translocase subunit SecF [Pseudoclavibacter sp.]
MASFQKLGNDLYTGDRSFDFVGRHRLFVIIAAVLMAVAVATPFLRGGLELGIEFTGGSEFTVSESANPDQVVGTEVATQYTESPPRVSVVGDGNVRVQTESLTAEQNAALREDLADAFGVDVTSVAVSTIGPTWGQDITRQMSIGIGVFIVLAAVLMALYFRTWKMALAAFAALVHDIVVTVGVYAITGVQLTPAAVIGFLTILGYSLYDTVVVFDKVRENTKEHLPDGSRTFGELVNLAINQTVVRSINTSIVAVLPVAAILFIGSLLLGAGTLRDISLALFIGIIVGALSTIFLAGPVYAWLRSSETRIKRIDERVRKLRGEDVEVTDGPIEPKRRRRRKRDVAGDPDAERASRASTADVDAPWELEGADEEPDDRDTSADDELDDDDSFIADDNGIDDEGDEEDSDPSDDDTDDAASIDDDDKPTERPKPRQKASAGVGGRARSTSRKRKRRRR